MKIKKIVGLFALACTMFMATQMVSAATNTASLGKPQTTSGVEIEYVQEGDVFRVPVYLDYDEGIENYQLNILYDEALVTPGQTVGATTRFGVNNITDDFDEKIGNFDTNVRDLVKGEGPLTLTNNDAYVGKTALILQWYYTSKVNVTSAKPVAYAYFTANADLDGNVELGLTMDLLIAGYSDANLVVTDFAPITTNIGTTTVLNKASVIKFEIAKNPGYFVHEVYVELDGVKYQLTKCTETETGYEFVVNVKNTSDAAKTVNSAKVMVAKADTDAADAVTTEEVYADLGTVTVEKY